MKKFYIHAKDMEEQGVALITPSERNEEPAKNARIFAMAPSLFEALLAAHEVGIMYPDTEAGWALSDKICALLENGLGGQPWTKDDL